MKKICFRSPSHTTEQLKGALFPLNALSTTLAIESRTLALLGQPHLPRANEALCSVRGCVA